LALGLSRVQILPNILLCGYERGGTTLLSDIFRSNGYNSGFECGVLMCKTPKDFMQYKPYIDMLYSGWGIEKDKFDHLYQKDFEHFYNTLIREAFSETFSTDNYFDKTPIYMSALGSCLNRTSFINKAVVIHRDPRAVFVSMARRLAKNKLLLNDFILKNLDYLTKRYLDYFKGCAAHFSNPDVLFVPFEELCTREVLFLKIIGNFSSGKSFHGRTKPSNFSNVEKQTMDISKVYEFKKFISSELEMKILDKTKLAAVFFADPYERVKYMDVYKDMYFKIDKLLIQSGLTRYGYKIEGVYFEPFTYLLKYKDVLDAKMNPITHFQRYGKYEGRNPC
jgi:hypothetical protein